MGNVVEITDSTFENEIIKSNISAIVYFWAEWCMPCKTMAPIVDEVAKEFDGKVKVAKINIDENNRMATDLTVMNLPTFIFFKDGQQLGRMSGVISKKDMIKKIEELF